MAGEDDDMIVQVDDLDTVQVSVDDNNPPSNKDQKAVEAKDKQPRTRTRRVSPDAETTIPNGPSPDQALAEAQAFAKQQEDARKAAEATAAAERQRADAAESARQQALKQAEEHQERANSSEISLVESRIASATNELAALQDAFEKAAEAGEFKTMGELQTKISKAAASLDRHEAMKADLEARPRQSAVEGAVTAPDNISAVEKHLRGYGPAAQNFMRQHLDCLPPELGGNATKHSMLMAGHWAAKGKGLQEGSEQYFKEIEQYINPPVAPPAVTTAAPTSRAAETVPARTSPPPAAPVSREPPDASGQPAPRSPREVRLTREQQEMAKLSFPHLPEAQAYGQYARNLLELQEEGKIGRVTH